MASSNCASEAVGAFCSACAAFSCSSVIVSTCMITAGGIGSPASSLHTEGEPISYCRSLHTVRG